MRTHTTAWITTLILVVIIVMVARYYDYIIKRDYLLEVNTNCNPTQEACFVTDCDAEDPECDQTPYKKVEIVANEAPECLEEHTCETFTCEGLDSCSITYCSDETIEDGEICTSAPEVPNEDTGSTSPNTSNDE